ncbi:MAG: flagellar biosynthesis protein FlhF [Planctomycetota bacterium]
MELKTYRAHSMADALAEVKKDLGGEAVILHTRTYRSGGVLGLGARPIVEITASTDSRAAASRPGRPRRRAPDQTSTRAAQSRFDPAAESSDGGAVATAVAEISTRAAAPASSGGGFEIEADGFRPERFPSADQPGRASLKQPAEPPVEAVQDEERRDLPIGLVADRSGAAPARVPTTRVAFSPADDVAKRSIDEELRAIKQLVGRVLRTQSSTSPCAGSPTSDAGAVAGLYADLIEREVPQEIAEAVCREVGGALDPHEQCDEQSVLAAARSRLAARLPVAQESVAARRVIALVGPTGVGKTTTIAKMAAVFKLRRGLRVGLVTSDTYRIAAVEQLRTYAGIIGLPLRVTVTPAEMSSAIADMSGCDVVLVDTAGRSQHDTKRIGELNNFLDAAAPTERHLVLSAAASQAVIASAAARFSGAGCDRLIVTKLDEAVHHGSLLHACDRSGLPLSYVSTGQEVPEDLDRASSERLAGMVLRGPSPAREEGAA